VIQTYSPEHYAVETAARQDYEAFYEEEIAYRELMGYPPSWQLLAVLITGEDESLLETAASYLKAYAERVSRGQIELIGPASPYVGKVKGVYRRVIYVKHARYEALTGMKDKLEQYIEMNAGFSSLRIQFDFNPMNIF
jgi:primosomal protein N' (replication factor Y)